MSGRAQFAAVLLVAVSMAAGRVRGQTAAPPADADRARARAELKKHIKKADRASAHREWEEAVFQLEEACKIAPDDTRLRDKLRRLLERRAAAYEARAAHPPPPPPDPPPPMFRTANDPPRGGIRTLLLGDRPWHAELKHAALQARIEAEAARPKPDESKLAQLRRELAAVEADQAQMAKTIADERAKAAAEQAAQEKEMEKAFGGMQGIGVAPSKTP
jgi:hypothetical protein